jgi:hypothetical protein
MSVPASLEGVYNQLFPPQERGEASDRCNDIVRDAIVQHLPELEELLGLQQPHAQFRDDLTQAISTCVQAHNFPPNRPAHKQKELAAVINEAANVVSSIRRLNSRIRPSAILYPPIKQRFLELGMIADEYARFYSCVRRTPRDSLIVADGRA